MCSLIIIISLLFLSLFNAGRIFTVIKSESQYANPILFSPTSKLNIDLDLGLQYFT
jgi:hypothetical protein